MSIAAGLTIEDFEKLPDALAHNHELVDGELVDVSGNTWEHNKLRDLFVLLMGSIAEGAGCTVITEQEFDFGGNAHGPDVAIIANAKRHLFNRKLRIQRFVPDVAIEIVSGNDKFAALMKKAKRYRKCGTSEVWVFCISTRQVFHLSASSNRILEDDGVFATELLPGFSIRIGELFDRL